MKVALCLSGQPRNVELGFPYIRDNVLNTCRPDVFVHVWDLPKGPITNAGGHVASEPIDETTNMVIKTMYRPIMMQVDPDIQFDERNYNERKLPGIRPKFSLSQRYSIKKANDLKTMIEQVNGKYDVVIRMRFDWAIRTPIHPEEFDLSGITVTDDCPHPNSVNDQFALGSSANMDVYASLYDHIQEYYDSGVTFCDELLLYHHLQVSQIPIHKRQISYGLIRHKDLVNWGRF